MRTVTVSYYVQRRDCVPMIRLRGNWLEAAGFGEGKRVAVDVSEGRLTLTAIERAEPDASGASRR
jgi:type I toxin-antitoxin system toxin SymE